MNMLMFAPYLHVKSSLIRACLAALVVLPGTKAALVQAVEQNQVVKYGGQVMWMSQMRTRYPLWFESEKSYEALFRPQYEPWFIANRLSMPLYDVSFRGFGRNRQLQVGKGVCSSAACTCI
jgi:hypothetical protein